MANAIFDAYLIDAPSARRFFPAHFADPAAREIAIANALKRPVAEDILSGIAAQNARLAPSEARSRNLHALAEGAAAVVSGQQVGLFLGPLFNLYKAATAVNLAARWSAESGRAVVPIFWLQTEDHDLAEIASCWVPRAHDAPLALSLDAPPERISIAHRTLPEEIAQRSDLLARELAGLPHAAETIALFDRHYRSGARWADAFAGVLAELFDGLVLIDPRDVAFSRVSRAVHRIAIERAAPIAGALLERSFAIEEAGFVVQVPVRPGIPLSFVHPRGPEGPREKIDPARLDPTLLDRELMFSTNVLLRPILQDSLLPTAAYVGGPGEVAYFAQLQPLYDMFQLAMPPIFPRARMRLIEEKTARALERLSLVPADAALAEEELLARSRTSDPRPDPFGASLDPLRETLARLHLEEPSLEKAIEKTLHNIERSLAKLREKLATAEDHKDRSRSADVRAVKRALMPEGTPQERFFSLPYYLARYGRGLLDRIIERIDPFDPRIQDVPLS